MSGSLLIRPRNDAEQSGVITTVTAGQAGWQFLNMEARILRKGQRWGHQTNDCEMAIVVLGGRCAVESDKGRWSEVGRRENVFDGMPYAIYLPRRTKFSVEPLSARVELACCWVETDQDHPAQLITPEQSVIEIRGGHNATRQINSIIPPGFDCHKIVCVEVYTPSGNWSSYPPHKHDEHKVDENGKVVEGDLEEIYFYKFNKPEGYAVQRVYSGERARDEVMVAQDNCVVLVPDGYHPVCSAYGYDCYYLNFLAGSAQTLACSFDPQYVWTMETWDKQDPRLPLVSHKMEEKVGA
jgi:5-deoxy-glucuronate isomerase